MCPGIFVCMIYIYIYIYYIYVYICTYVLYIYIDYRVCMYVNIYVYVCKHTYIHMYARRVRTRAHGTCTHTTYTCIPMRTHVFTTVFTPVLQTYICAHIRRTSKGPRPPARANPRRAHGPGCAQWYFFFFSFLFAVVYVFAVFSFPLDLFSF